MKVKVEYTRDVTDVERANVAAKLGEWPDRDTLKAILEEHGTGGLHQFDGEAESKSVGELADAGVPAAVIVTVLG